MTIKEPFLIFTDDQCVIEGTVFCGLPMLVDYDHRIIEAASDWLRHLTVFRRKSERSVRQFAYHLKYWWSYINRRGISWEAVDDFVLVAWREELIREGIKERTINGYVSTIFRFYLWAERSGYTRGLIGEPDLERNIHPPLSVNVKFRKRGVKTYSSPVLVCTTQQSIVPTPTNDEITLVHEALTELYGTHNDLFIRDTLILTWMEQTGVRRAEAISVKAHHIPEWNEIDALQESGEKLEVTINGKGGKRRSIWVGADLLSQTREYIEEEREATVKRFRAQLGTSYKRPKELFLSSKTGLALDPDSVSQIFAKAFRKAKVRGSGHRVRARFLTNLAGSMYAAEYEKRGSIPDSISTLLPVAQIAGHARVESLIPYIVAARKRLLRMTDAERSAESAEKAIASERRAESSSRRLSRFDSLRDLVEAMKSEQRNKVAEELQKLLEMYL